MKRIAALAVMSVAGLWGQSAQPVNSLPTPIMTKATPQMIYPKSPGWLDASGRVVVVITGENLAYDESRPSTPDLGYQHVYVRGVSPHGDKVTPWFLALEPSGVRLEGRANKSALILSADPARFLSEPGSHLQVKLWVSEGPTVATEPARAGTLHSEWSAIRTIDVAPAGVTKPVPPPAPVTVPSISRILPGEFQILPTTTYRVKVYGKNFSNQDSLQVIFNGDEAGGLSPETAVLGYENNALVPDGDFVFQVTIPEKYRRTTPGSLRVALRKGPKGTLSVEKLLTFNYAAKTAAGPAGAPPANRPLLGSSPGATSHAQAALPPTLTRVSPGSFKVGDKASSYRLRIYGRQVGGAGTRLVFNGEEASAVPAEDLARPVDDDGTPLKDGERVFHVTLPERFRRSSPGPVSVVALQGTVRTNALKVDFEAAALRPAPQLAPAAVAAPKAAPKAPGIKP